MKDLVSLWKEEKDNFKQHLSKAEKKSEKKRKRAEEKKNGPKRPKTAYLYFCEEERPKVKKEKPDLKATEVMKELGGRWSNLSDKAKKPFVTKADKDRSRYNGEKEEKEGKKGPKRPKSSYLYFCADERANVKKDHPDFKVTEVISELGRRWKALKDEEKEQYIEQSKVDRDRYIREKEEFTGEKKEKK